MARADSDEFDDSAENVRYDLAGNPLSNLPSTSAPPASMPQRPGGPAPSSFNPPPTFTPPPGNSTSGGAATSHAAQKSPGALLLYAGLGIGAIVIIGLIFALRSVRPVIVSAPTSYQTYTALDSTFSCDQPVGWERKESGSPGGSLSSVIFLKGNARFKVISDATGSLMSESTNSANANLPPAQQTPPVQKLHETDRSEMADSVSGYQEGKATPFTSSVGDSRASEWTAGNDGGSKLHGYRITMLDKEREITVICSCPERNWAILKPSFLHMVSSIAPGNG